MEPCYTDAVPQAIAWYREFLPCQALESEVYAFFSFVPGPSVPPPHRPLLREIAFTAATFCSPQFADGHVSTIFELGRTCEADGRWHDDAVALGGTVIGPMTGVGRTEGGDRPEMVGVYFRPAHAHAFLGVAMSELADRAVDIDDVWGSAGAPLVAELRELDEGRRIDRLESVLMTRLTKGRQRAGSLDMHGLAASVLRRNGQVTVESMAQAAGVSRQYLAREFREWIGVPPKVYSRLARFHSGLAYADSPPPTDWALAAIDMGYADQSHMISEFRQFSGLSPHALASGHWFHPFIERARSRRGRQLRFSSKAAPSRR